MNINFSNFNMSMPILLFLAKLERVVSLGPNPTRIATNRWLSRCLRTQARSLTDREKRNNAVLWAKGAKGMSSAYIRVKEVRGQVPGTTCNRARTNSAINNKQASSYIRAEREWRAGTTASSAKGGRPGTTAVVPRRHLLASSQGFR